MFGELVANIMFQEIPGCYQNIMYTYNDIEYVKRNIIQKRNST